MDIWLLIVIIAAAVIVFGVIVWAAIAAFAIRQFNKAEQAMFHEVRRPRF